MVMELLSAASTIRQLQEEVLNLQQQLASSILKQETLTKQLNEGKQEPTPITSDCPQCQIFSPEVVVNSKQKNLFTHYTGLTYATFIVLFRFLVPDPAKNPVVYRERPASCMKLCLKDQLFLVLCRLRCGFPLVDLAHHFNTSPQIASVLFNSWMSYMYFRQGGLSIWPDREAIVANMPEKYRSEFPSSIASIGCTELKTQKTSSLAAQSQCYSDYKSSTTLKSLVVTDPEVQSCLSPHCSLGQYPTRKYAMKAIPTPFWKTSFQRDGLIMGMQSWLIKVSEYKMN